MNGAVCVPIVQTMVPVCVSGYFWTGKACRQTVAKTCDPNYYYDNISWCCVMQVCQATAYFSSATSSCVSFNQTGNSLTIKANGAVLNVPAAGSGPINITSGSGSALGIRSGGMQQGGVSIAGPGQVSIANPGNLVVNGINLTKAPFNFPGFPLKPNSGVKQSSSSIYPQNTVISNNASVVAALINASQTDNTTSSGTQSTNSNQSASTSATNSTDNSSVSSTAASPTSTSNTSNQDTSTEASVEDLQTNTDQTDSEVATGVIANGADAIGIGNSVIAVGGQSFSGGNAIGIGGAGIGVSGNSAAISTGSLSAFGVNKRDPLSLINSPGSSNGAISIDNLKSLSGLNGVQALDFLNKLTQTNQNTVKGDSGHGAVPSQLRKTGPSK
jgi:hypothetical protein